MERPTTGPRILTSFHCLGPTNPTISIYAIVYHGYSGMAYCDGFEGYALLPYMI